jgi:hypothetical protein
VSDVTTSTTTPASQLPPFIRIDPPTLVRHVGADNALRMRLVARDGAVAVMISRLGGTVAVMVNDGIETIELFGVPEPA